MMQVLLSQLKPMELNKYLNSLQENEKFEIFSNPKNVLELNDSVFLMAFQQLSSEIKQKLLTDKRIAKRILEKSASARIKSPIDYLSEEEKTILLKHTDLLIQMGESILEKILERKESLELKELTAGISTALKENKVPEQNKKLLRIQQLIKNEATVAELKTIWNFKETDLQSLITLSTQSKRNPLVLLKIKTEDEFIFYLKTGCVISKKEIESLQIPIELIEKLNMKSLSKLVAIYQEHLNNNHYNLSDEKVLITVLNTYLVFGYDNARKILLDFFTYPTESSKIKQADIEFREARKEYRLTHQNEFYSHILAKEVYQELMDIMSGETEAENSHTFQMVLQSKDKEKCEMFYQELMAILRQKRTNLEETISDFLKEKIKTREEEKKNIYIQENKEKNIVKPNENTLYSLFKGLDYNKIKLDENGNPIINKKLTTLFLGNEKRKNDCLLRMIISKNIFGAKDHVIAIINNFSLIEAEINRSNGLLSLNSLSDVMKVYQVTCFSLDYDEEDISLSTIAKINKSKEFVENSEIDIVKAMLEYHKLRKWKTNLSIPFVSGITREGVKYSIMKNNSQEILTAGIDHNCCFKAGAKGEDFFHYCLTSPNAGIIKLEVLDEKKSFMVPFIVNGNTIYGNGIEPKIPFPDLELKLFDAIQECYQMISEKSFYETIEVGILTNLHLEKLGEMRRYPQIIIEEVPTQEKIQFYSDLTKKEKEARIIFQKEPTSRINHYERSSRYEQSRKRTFYYAKDSYEKNAPELKKLQSKINNVYYTYLKLNNSLNPQTFTPIELNNWDVAVGNDDWFILKKGQAEIHCILPYYQYVDMEVNIAIKNIIEEEQENERKSHQ